MADENDLVLPQLLAQHVGELDAVLGHARDRDGLRRRIRVLSECSAGASLIPLDHREVLQPQPEPGITPRVGRVARSAVKKEQHRVVPVFSANRDPLLDAANLDVPRLVDAVWSGDGVIARIPRAQGCPCCFELLAVGAGRRILPGGRDGDGNKKQEWPRPDGCKSHESPPIPVMTDPRAILRHEDGINSQLPTSDSQVPTPREPLERTGVNSHELAGWVDSYPTVRTASLGSWNLELGS